MICFLQNHDISLTHSSEIFLIYEHWFGSLLLHMDEDIMLLDGKVSNMFTQTWSIILQNYNYFNITCRSLFPNFLCGAFMVRKAECTT